MGNLHSLAFFKLTNLDLLQVFESDALVLSYSLGFVIVATKYETL